MQKISRLWDFENIRKEWDKLHKMEEGGKLFLTDEWVFNWGGHFGE